MTDNTLTVERLQASYLVPRQHPHPEQVKAQLDNVMQTRLPAIVAARLERFAPSDDPSLWFIRRLETDLVLDVGEAKRAVLGQAWGSQLATAIGRTLLRPPDGRNVVRFADREAYIAQFIIDLIAGQAWDKWYYGHFEALRNLMTGQAVREAIIREAGRAPKILTNLSQRNQFERVLGVISENDAGRIFRACLMPEVAAEPTRPAFERLLALWKRARLCYDGRWAGTKNKLRLWLVAQQDPAPRTGLASSIDHLLHFADLLSHLAQPGLFLHYVSRGQRAEAIALSQMDGQTAGLESVPILEAAAAGDLNWLQRAAAVIAPAAADLQAADDSLTAVRSILTHCGGLFLLLPTLLDLGLHQLLAEHAPAGEEGDVAAIWRYWLTLKCLGKPQRSLSRDDPALLLAVGLNAQPDAETHAGAVAAATLARLAALWQGLVANLQQQGRVDGRFLAIERLATDPEMGVMLLRDMRHDYWLYAGVDRPQQPQAALDALAGILGQPVETVWQEGHPCPVGMAEYARKAKTAEEALDYFHLPELPPQVDLTFTLLAQAVLRAFARRLMGFAWSSPAYLYQNFLAGQSAIHSDDDGLHVQIPPAPLRMILQMAAFNGAEYAIPWLDDRRVTLNLNDEP